MMGDTVANIGGGHSGLLEASDKQAQGHHDDEGLGQDRQGQAREVFREDDERPDQGGLVEEQERHDRGQERQGQVREVFSEDDERHDQGGLDGIMNVKGTKDKSENLLSEAPKEEVNNKQASDMLKQSLEDHMAANNKDMNEEQANKASRRGQVREVFREDDERPDQGELDEEQERPEREEVQERHHRQGQVREGCGDDERHDQGEHDEAQERQDPADDRAAGLLRFLRAREEARGQCTQWQRSSWWSEWDWR